MSRVKMVRVTYVTVLVFGVLVSASSAAPAGWMVNKTNLSTTVALSPTARIDKALELTAAGVTIECKGEVLTSTGSVLNEATLMLDSNSFKFSGCQSITQECTLGQTTIETLPLLVDVTLDGVLAIKGKLLAKKAFGTLLYEGEACALAGVQAITGAFSFLMHTGQDEKVVQIALVSSGGKGGGGTEGELKVGSSSASISGSMLLTTEKSLPFSFL